MVGLTTEQAQTITAALDSHVRRMRRDYIHKTRKAETLIAEGETAQAMKVAEALPERQARIDAALNVREIITRSMESE